MRKTQWQKYFGAPSNLYVGEYSVLVMSLKTFPSRNNTDMSYLNSMDISLIVVDGVGYERFALFTIDVSSLKKRV